MTKIYEGGGVYTVSFGCSGKTIELTEDEMKELAEESPAYQELQEEYDTDRSELKQIHNSIEEQGQYIREIEGEILPKLDECIHYIRRQSYKKEYRNILNQLEGALSELDSLGKYI